VPAPPGGHFALRRLVSVPTAQFAEDNWGRLPLLSVAAKLPQGFDDLFSNDAVDELISRRGLRTPFLRVAKNGNTLPDRAFSEGGGVGAAIADQVSDDQLLRLFADGATIVLQGLHRTWEPILAFSQELAADLGHPTQVNAYVTPAQNTGFSDHYDVHDVFVLQIAGEKRWRIRRPVRESPLRDEPWTDRRAAVEAAAQEEPLIEATLRPGDCLYLPRGYLHAATALGDVSTHLTIGVHPWTRRHLTDELVSRAVRRASQDERVRQSLGVGVDLSDETSWAADLDVVRESLIRAIRDLPPVDLRDSLVGHRRRTQRAAPIAPVAQVRAAASLDEGAEVVLRRHLDAHIVPRRNADGASSQGDRTYAAVLRSRAGDLELSGSDVQKVHSLLADGRASVSALGLPLTRRLVLSGVAIVDQLDDDRGQ
jgi:bifunctional lysine-specific demethylase and histidyl-hydroxylase NO66